VAAQDPTKPLLSKLLAVPALRARYLSYVRDFAERCLDWNILGPLAARYQELVVDIVRADTRKNDSFEAFLNGAAGVEQVAGGWGAGRGLSLKRFAEERRDYLLGHAEVKAARRPVSD